MVEHHLAIAQRLDRQRLHHADAGLLHEVSRRTIEPVADPYLDLFQPEGHDAPAFEPHDMWPALPFMPVGWVPFAATSPVGRRSVYVRIPVDGSFRLGTVLHPLSGCLKQDLVDLT